MKGRWFSKWWDGSGIFFKVFIVCPTNLLAYYNETPKILFTSHHNPESSILSVIKDSVTFGLHFKFTSSTSSSSSIFFLRTSDYITNLLRLDGRKSSSNCSCLSPQKQEATQESTFSVIMMLSYIIVVIIYLFIHYYCYHFNKAFSFS